MLIDNFKMIDAGVYREEATRALFSSAADRSVTSSRTSLTCALRRPPMPRAWKNSNGWRRISVRRS